MGLVSAPRLDSPQRRNLAADITLALVLSHVAAVVFPSFAHRENLVRAMITGYKRP